MSDHSEKGSDPDEVVHRKKHVRVSSSEEDHVSESKKTCADCGTTKTPLWRGGPAGPKSLCNACGIRSRKKRRAVLGITKEEKKSRKGGSSSSNSSHSSSSSSNNNGNNSNSSNKLGDNLKQRLMALGREVLMQRSTAEMRQRRKLGEEEQAAVLLMALSYGSVYA